MRLVAFALGLALVAIVIVVSEAFSAPMQLGERLEYGDAAITVDDSGFSSVRNNPRCVARGRGFACVRVRTACSADATDVCPLRLTGQVEHENGSSWGSGDHGSEAVHLQPGKEAPVGTGVQGCWYITN